MHAQVAEKQKSWEHRAGNQQQSVEINRKKVISLFKHLFRSYMHIYIYIYARAQLFVHVELVIVQTKFVPGSAGVKELTANVVKFESLNGPLEYCLIIRFFGWTKQTSGCSTVRV